MATRNLKIAGNEWPGIDRLQIPTTDSTEKATFIETSDGDVSSIDIVKDKKAYSKGEEVTGTLPPLTIENSNTIISDNGGAYLYLPMGESISGEYQFVTSTFETALQESSSDSIDLEFEFSVINWQGEAQEYSGIHLEPITAGAGAVLYYKQGSSYTHPVYVSQDHTIKGIEYSKGWQPQWHSVSDLEKITYISGLDSVEKKESFLKIARSLSGVNTYHAYAKVKSPAYLKPNDDFTALFRISGFESLTPDVVAFGTEIPGIQVQIGDSTTSFIGTLEAAKISKNGSILTIE